MLEYFARECTYPYLAPNRADSTVNKKEGKLHKLEWHYFQPVTVAKYKERWLFGLAVFLMCC